MRGLSLVVASGGHSSSRCAGLSLSWPLLLRSTGSRRPGSVAVALWLSCSAACGIFPDQGSNPCPLHWQADSQPLRHQGSPGLSSWSLFLRLCVLGCPVSLNACAQTSPPAPSSSFSSTLSMPPLYPQLPHTNSLTKLLLFSSETIRICPFNIKPSEDPKAKPLISYTPWTKAEL